MLEEAAVLGGEHGLGQVVGEILQRDGIVVADAAGADLVAVAVEEGDRELAGLEPVVLAGFAERRDRERERPDQRDGAEAQTLRHRLDEVPAPPAGDVEAVHEYGEALVELAAPALELVHAEVDARVEVEQHAPDARPPTVRPRGVFERVAQGFSAFERWGMQHGGTNKAGTRPSAPGSAVLNDYS